MGNNLLELQALGVEIALEGFGAGYSSLSYMKRFAINNLKIDRVSISGLGIDSDDTALALSIIDIAEILRCKLS
jgi:EAL domain-containing protein (putative c-di-GMP-specific phosphodiesterase class I)